MVDVQSLQAQFITDQKGRKTAVIIPVEKFEGLLEDLIDLASIVERREEATISFEDVIERLKRDGFLQPTSGDVESETLIKR